MSVQVRKTVTVLFADIVGSTALGEQVDPEAIRGSLATYFDAMRGVIEQHGGIVEKFVGDAVMAVFGIPELHEDDALRAVRAAAAMRERLATLDLPVSFQMRIGVTTGEVVAGDGETFATGDAVNVAARLEAAAEPGEILLGDATHALVTSAIRAESLEALDLKGKSVRVPAYRLLEVLPGAPAYTRRLDAPFVGRARELRRLLGELERARADAACRLAVVTGEAGIGKSRLVRELVREAREDARVLVGRCLSYGEGITYWPLREIVHQVGGDSPRAGLVRILDESSADAILGAVGLAPVAAQSGEIHWSVRRLLEELARERPLVVVLDDLHWAEPTFLDLVDYLHGFTRDAPIVVVATGRAELLEQRPGWRSAALELAPLDEGDVARLVHELASELPEDRRARVADAAEGNPLFVEQLLAMAAAKDGELVVPPTIQALLATRIDALSSEERTVLECGAVEGRLFHRGSVTTLAPEPLRPEVMKHLLALVRSQLVRPDEPVFRGEDAFRFGHALIRDAAYNAAPKALRAELHERYAQWLEDAAADRVDELAEILAYHVEQAALFAAEVGRGRSDLGARAGALLVGAGARALSRGDVAAAAGLLRRATAVLPPSRERANAGAHLAVAELLGGDVAAAAAAVASAAGETGADEATRARVAVADTFVGTLMGTLSPPDVRGRLEPALGVLRAAGDEVWTVRALLVLTSALAMDTKIGPIGALLMEAFGLERAMADAELRSEVLFWVGGGLVIGPHRLSDAHAQLDAIAAHAETRLDQAWLDFPRAMLAAFEGRFDESRALYRSSRGVMQESGALVHYAATAMFAARAELLAGDPRAAEPIAREGWELLGAAGESSLRSTVGTTLAEALVELGRDDEAESIAAEADAMTQPADVTTHCYARGVLSRIRSRAGRHDEAVRLAREAVEIAQQGDSVWHHLDMGLFLAEAARAAGLRDEQRAAAADALRLVDEFGFSVFRERAQSLVV